MTLTDLIDAVETLSSDELETLYTHIQAQRVQRQRGQIPSEQRIQALDEAMQALREDLSDDEIALMIDAMNDSDDRHPPTLDMEAINRLSAELREGFSEQDLDDWDRSTNIKVIKPLLLDDEL